MIGLDFFPSEETENAGARIERERKERERRRRSMGASIGIRRGESQKVTKAIGDPLGVPKSIIHNSRKGYLMS